jgi:hypothetical protein
VADRNVCPTKLAHHHLANLLALSCPESIELRVRAAAALSSLRRWPRPGFVVLRHFVPLFLWRHHMPATIRRPATQPRKPGRVSPSLVNPATAEPITLDQELKPFGAWVGDPIWVPPKDSSKTLAATMLRESRPFTSRDKRWAAVVKRHRADFTQVRELDLFQASIRLPKGRFFVTVTEEKHFDQITDPIPRCVQTRLEEFMEGPAKKRGAKVYYLKPLAIEIGDDLVLTTGEDLTAAIAKIQNEVFAEYRSLALRRRPLQALAAAANLGLAVPRAVVKYVVDRKKRAIDALQAHLEFERRKVALESAKNYRKCRAAACSFDEMLGLTSPLKRTDVVHQFCTEQEVPPYKRELLLQIATGAMPWFFTLSFATSYASTLAWFLLNPLPPIIACDPAFVAELPGSNGVVLKIGHFDEVAGVTHVEI